ncbi:MAG: hypothetical protein E6R03_07140 [Hyphomicrobiaceae bacterium]|nr:MAG: hypothetical protein E6R03_07140 [Hyphomicrobiaceae bacterium]
MSDEQEYLYHVYEDAWQLKSLPSHMRMPMFRYLAFGITGEGFMTSILSGNYYGAVLRADVDNLRQFTDWIRWLNESCPQEAWGSREAVNDWCRSGGLRGISSGTLIAR